MAKIHSGTYGKDSIESNSFVANLMKYPEISSVMIQQFPQYSLNYFTDGLGRYAKEQMIGDNKFQWSVLGRLNRPSTLTGAGTGNGSGGAVFSRETEENYMNPNDIVKFADGRTAIILNEPTPTTGGYTFQMKLTGALGVADTGVSAAALASGVTVGTAGNAFSESSFRGYENHVYPDWYINYTSIHRKSKKISGSALTDILWIESGGQKLWFHKDVNLMTQEFLYQRELDDWYGVTTVDANGVSTVIDPKTGLPIYKGEGILRQISSSNMDTYNGILTEDQITSFMTTLSLNTGVKNQHWLVFTGKGGMLAFHRAMKDLVVTTGAYIYNAQVGKDVKLGGNFVSYHAVGVTMTLVHNPIFDDPNLHGNNIDPGTGLPKESFRMVFTDFSTDNDGVSNIERKVKGAGGINRGMIMKYIPGMVNPYDQKSMYAASGKDGFECEVLSESSIIIRNTLSCGQLVYA
jgi:hypothetical protein